ncbi:chloride channel protein [Bacillus cereus]|uniref:chloride channel protein n=1 Tax=Bacillus paramycoides TaxID=2026194 RepID=UPI000BF65D0B|nr:chloride channel protein [Bacillus paramycoides]PFD36738.1 chloride channel protein [Bacillus cereus]
MTIMRDRHYLFIMYGMILGSIVGATAWLFLSLVNVGIWFVWDYTPEELASPAYYTICVTTIGGVLIGLAQKYLGTYPRLMPEVMSEYKETGRIEYSFVHQSTLTAMIALIFGASLGPEAALVGIIGGLCTWIGDRFTFTFKGVRELTEAGIGAALSVIFNVPLFGYFALSENEKDRISEISKINKDILYLATTFAGFLVFIWLSKLDNSGSFIVNFEKGTFGLNEWISLLPLTCIGAGLGYFYFKIEHILEKVVHPFKEYKLALGIIGGILLGILGTLFPYTMFSGAHELPELVQEWTEISFWLLLIVGILKLCTTAICLTTGWRGGHLFPIIFAGASIGYAIATVVPLNSTASVALVTTTILSYVLQKPIAATVLLLMFFPINLLLPMLGAAFIGNVFPIPKHMRINNDSIANAE